MDAYLGRYNVLRTPNMKLNYIQHNSVRDLNVPPRIISVLIKKLNRFYFGMLPIFCNYSTRKNENT